MSSVVDSLEIVALQGGEATLLNLINACDENRLFFNDDEASKEAVALINRFLNEASSRKSGLLILRCVLGQLQTETLQNNVLSWLQQTVKGLSQIDSPATVIAAADSLKLLLQVSSKFPEIRKETSLSLIGKISESLYALRNNYSVSKVHFMICSDLQSLQRVSVSFILEALLVVQEEYNKGAYSWKDRWEQFVLSLPEEDERVVFLAGKCYLGLACSGHPGTDHVNFKNNWLDQFRNLSWYLHQILDKLIVNLPEIHQFSRGNHKEPKLQIPTVNEKIPFVRISRLTSQFVGLGAFVRVILLGKYPASKRIVPELVFSVICRGLAVTAQVLRSHVTSDTVPLLAQLPRLHMACLSTLEALIRSCRTNLLSYGPVICKLITQVLKSTQNQEGAYGQPKPYRSVRKSAYECLKSWLTAASCSSGVEKHPEIVEFIISDILFKKPAVTLNLSSKTLKGKMGKKQRQALVNQTIDNKDDFSYDVKANKELCAAALRVIPALLESASSLLKSSSHKNIQTIICNRIFATQLNSGENVPLPYSDQTCRLGLYESFVSLCLNYHPNFPPPLTYATRILENGQHDPCPEIVQFCAMAMNSVDKMLRPIGPTLCFPIDLDESTLAGRLATLYPSNQLNLPQEQVTPNGFASDSPVIDKSENVPISTELTVNNLLEDVEMSEFDYLDQQSPAVKKEAKREEIKSESDQNRKLTSDSISELETEQQCYADAFIADKRKAKPEEILPSKKVKTTAGQNELTESRKSSKSTDSGVTSKVTDSSKSPIQETSTRTEDTSMSEVIEITAENELEEEMLSSFVDDVI